MTLKSTSIARSNPLDCRLPPADAPDQLEDRSWGESRAPIAPSLFKRSAVRINEERVWAAIDQDITTIAKALSHERPIRIVEIGGSSLQGLSILRRRANLPPMDYLIVDNQAVQDVRELRRLQGRFVQGSGDALTPRHLSGQIDFIIGIRALEYDSNYGLTLRNLRLLCGQKSYAIFAHNAESSSIFRAIALHALVLQTRIKASELVLHVASSKFDHRTAGTFMATKLDALPPDLAERELQRFARGLERLESCPDSTSERRYIEKVKRYLAYYRNELGKLTEAYAERINSRRFWETQDRHRMRQDYLPYGPLLLQRELIQTRGGLDLHLDTVDMYSPQVERAPRIFQQNRRAPAYFAKRV